MKGSSKKAIWLITYPKSGTTWFRSFITAICNKGQVNINKLLPETSYFGSKSKLHAVTSLSPSLLTSEETYHYKALYIDYLLKEHKENRPLFLHTHELVPDNQVNFITPENSLGIIYIVRNPMAVATSLASYSDIPIDKAIEMLNEGQRPLYLHSPTQLRGMIDSWSVHVKSWTSQPTVPTVVLRYEDMVSRPFETFSDTLKRLNFQVSDELIQASIEATQFSKLKQQEKQNNFIERPINALSFFRKGKMDSWKEELTQKQQELIIEQHRIQMKKHQYI